MSLQRAPRTCLYSSFWFNCFSRLTSFIRKCRHSLSCNDSTSSHLDGTNRGLIALNLVRKSMAMVSCCARYSSTAYPSLASFSSTFSTPRIEVSAVCTHFSFHSICVCASFYRSFQFYRLWENITHHADSCSRPSSVSTSFIIHGQWISMCLFFLLRTSILCLFARSAMSNNPDPRCNPSIRSIIHPSNITESTTTANPNPTRQQNIFDPITLIGLVMFAGALFYSIMTTSRHNRANKLFLSSSSSSAASGYSTVLDDVSMADTSSQLDSDDKTHQHVYDDESGSVTYNYSLFHFMLVLATLYAMMTLTK